MPNERHRRRPVRRAKPASRLRVAPYVLFALMAAAVVDRPPTTEAPIRWTMRDADAWMADFDGLRDARLAGSGSMARLVDARPLAPTAIPPLAAAAPAVPAPMVVAEADLAPRDVPKTVPLDAVEPEITGAVPGGRRPQPQAPTQAAPSSNRSGKGDRLFSPQPYGRTTDGDVFVKPSLAVVPPSLEGWPPLVTLASLTAPQSDRTLPRLALAPTPKSAAADRVVVAMVRSGPGRVVTQSVIASLDPAARRKGRILLPPVPEQVAAGPRVGQPGAAAMPEMGYVRATDIETRFRAVLGDGDAGLAPAGTPDDQLPP